MAFQVRPMAWGAARMGARAVGAPSDLAARPDWRGSDRARLTLCCMMVAFLAAEARGQGLMTRLTSAGVDLPAGRRLAVPEPALRTGMPPAEQIGRAHV